MSRKNNLERRRKHHAAMLADERVREAKLRKKRESRRRGKVQKATDNELSAALDKLATVSQAGEKQSTPPHIGAPIAKPEDQDVQMKVASIGPGRIRKKSKKARERSKKIRERMLARKAMLA